MPDVRCPYCQKVLASAFTEDRARTLAVKAKADHACKAVAPPVTVNEGLVQVVLHDRR